MNERKDAALRRSILKSGLGVGLAGVGIAAFAQAKKYGPGASDSEIVIGNTGPYSGPASAYAIVPKSFGALFQQVNEKGGINGRKIRYISLDDAFSPPKTVEQVRRLVEKEQVLLMFGMIGSTNIMASQKYLEERKVPNLFVVTGATRWGDYGSNPYTMGFGPNYTTEGKAYAQHLLKERPNAKIAVLYQSDEFGRDLYAGFRAGLGSRAKEMLVAERTYEATDATIDSQIIGLQASGADTLMNFSISKFASMTIRKVAQMGWRPMHFLAQTSASVGSVLTPAGLDNCVGLISSTYAKDWSDPQWASTPSFVEWRAFVKKSHPDGSLDNPSSFGAAMIAKALVHVLKQCGNDLTRENVMRQAANLKDVALEGLLPGIKINTSPTDYYPIEQLRLMRFDGKQWVYFGELLGKA